MKYFKDCQTQEELKKQFREWCKKLHPDAGGDPAEFIAMREEFEKAAAGETWRTFKNKEGQTYTRPAADVSESPAEFIFTIMELLKLEGVQVEICGTWLWITGDTWRHRETIKKLGGKWSKNKSAWYIHREKYRKHNKKVYTLEEIRGMYGSQTFEHVNRDKLEAAS